MKSFIASLVTLAVLCGAVCANCIYVENRLSELIEICDSLPDSVQDATKAHMTKLCDKWESCRRYISFTVDHREVDAIGDAVSLLSVCVKTESSEQYAAALEQLSGLLNRLAESEALTLDGIL